MAHEFHDIGTDEYTYRRRAEVEGCASYKLYKFLCDLPDRTGLVRVSTSGLQDAFRQVGMFVANEVKQKLKDPENRYLIRGVLDCECVSCKRVFTCSCQDADELFQKIIGPEPAVLLLAILAYLGTTFMIHDCIDHGLRDHNLGNMSSFLMQQGPGGGYDLFHRLNYDLEEDCDQTSQEISQVLTEMITSFTRNFNEAKERFFPIFLKRDMDIRRFHQDSVFPYPYNAIRKSGNQGNVYIIKIYKQFQNLHENPAYDIPEESDGRYKVPVLKLVRKEVPLTSSKPVKEAAENERLVLEFFTQQEHPNIIPLCLWYDHCNTRNFIFPCYEGDLGDVLCHGLVPSDVSIQEISFPKFPKEHWLWRGMIGILDGLKTVHNPDWSKTNRIAEVLAGAHFDLKPENILVSHSGKLVVSDFGIARLKAGNVETVDRAGSEIYAPPDTETDGNGTWFAKRDRTYDVWSMACMIIEVLHFIIVQDQDGRQVEDFREVRFTENQRYNFWLLSTPPEPGPSGRKRTHMLKTSVQDWLHQLEDLYIGEYYNMKVVNRLRTMLSIDYKLRGTIADCWQELSTMEDPVRVLPASIVPPAQRIEEAVDWIAANERLRDRKTELGYVVPSSSPPQRDRRHTFSHMPMKMLDGNKSRHCRIKVFEDPAKVTVTTTYVKGKEVICEVESALRNIEELVVFNRFSTNDPGSELIIWGFKNLSPGKQLIALGVESFYRIQEALTCQKCEIGTRQLLSKCVIKPYSRIGLSLSNHKEMCHSTSMIEIWTECRREKFRMQKKNLKSHKSPARSITSSNTDGDRNTFPPLQNNHPHLSNQDTTRLSPMLQKVSTVTSSSSSDSGARASTMSADNTPAATGVGPRLIIFWQSENNCVTIPLYGKTTQMVFPPHTGGNLVVQLKPNNRPEARHRSIRYHLIPMTTATIDEIDAINWDSLRGIPLEPTVLETMEEKVIKEDALYAEYVEMTFQSFDGLRQFKEKYKRLFSAVEWKV